MRSCKYTGHDVYASGCQWQWQVCQWRNGKCVYVSVCVCVCVSLQLISFKLSSGYLFRPHHVNQGGVQKADVQVCVILEEVLCNTLSASVGYRNDVAALRMPADLTRCSQATILLDLHPPHCSCSEVKTARLSPFGVRGCPITRVSCHILILPILILRITPLIVVVSIYPCLLHVGSRVPLVLRLGILLIPSVSLVNHWLKLLWRFDFVLFFPIFLVFGNHVFWIW